MDSGYSKTAVVAPQLYGYFPTVSTLVCGVDERLILYFFTALRLPARLYGPPLP